MELYGYLKRIFKNNVKQSEMPYFNMSLMVRNNYKFSQYSIYGRHYVCMSVVVTQSLRKYIAQVNNIIQIVNMPVVLVVEQLTLREREILIDNHINFIVIGKQLFIPEMGVILEDRDFIKQDIAVDKFTPMTQLLYIHMLINARENEKVYFYDLEKKLKFNKITLKRVVENLIAGDFIKCHYAFGKSFIVRELSDYEYCVKAFDKLVVPYSKEYFVDKSEVPLDYDNLVKAGITALSKIGMLQDNPYETYAITSDVDKEIPKKCKVDYYFDNMVKLQVYKYDVKLLGRYEYIDKVSLVASLQNDNDDRVLMEIDRLKEEYRDDIIEI